MFNQCPICYSETTVVYELQRQNVCPNCFITKFDFISEEDIDHWITTSTGQRIPVTKGQSNADAINSLFGDKNKLVPQKEHEEFSRIIMSENLDDVKNLYKKNKSFANTSDVLSMYSMGLSRELNDFDNGKIDVKEFYQKSKDLGINAKSINDENIDFNKETLRDGLTTLHKTINSQISKNMTLYRGFTTKDINDPKFKFDITKREKFSGLNAFSINEDKALSFSVPHSDRMGDSVLLTYKGDIKALPTKLFASKELEENEFITNQTLTIDTYRIENRIHKNNNYKYKRYYIDLKLKK